MINKWYKSKY